MKPKNNNKKTKILIDVSGGIVQEVFSNSPFIDVVLIDWDNIDTGEKEGKAIRRFSAVFDEGEIKRIINDAKGKIKKNQDFSLKP